MNFWIVQSKIYPNVWFIFRENGVEVKIEKVGETIFRSHVLTVLEKIEVKKIFDEKNL